MSCCLCLFIFYVTQDRNSCTSEKITNNKLTINELLIFKKPGSCIYAKMPLNEITHNNEPPFDKKQTNKPQRSICFRFQLALLVHQSDCSLRGSNVLRDITL